MDGKNSVFIDLSNMNVLFRDGASLKFVMVLNYAGALERLSATLSAWGSGYDLYLCLKPRAPGEGDYVIDDLSMSGAPFVVDAAELHSVLNFFRHSVGVSEIYLCNWLNNYVHQARVGTFDSAFYYGDRVLLLSAQEKMVTRFQIYNSAVEFYEANGSDFAGYGDLGLIDVDGFKAQYPEFRQATRSQITSIAPLAHCYRTSCRITTDDLYEQLTEFLKTGSLSDKGLEQEPELEEPAVALEPEEPADSQGLGIDFSDMGSRVKTRWTVPTVALVVASFVLTGVLATCYGYTRFGKVEDESEAFYAKIDERVQGLNRVKEVYQAMEQPEFDTVSVFDFVSNSGIEVIINGFERYPDKYVVRCSYVSDDIKDAFVEYISESYSVVSTADLGAVMIDDVEGRQIAIQFG